jgi:hypothetical protein
MKHKTTPSMLLTIVAIAFFSPARSQVQFNPISGQYWLDPHNPPSSFTIGNNFNSGYSLEVRGDLMRWSGKTGQELGEA